MVISTRYIRVQILWNTGEVEWTIIPWGKKYLDVIRKHGGEVIFHVPLQ